MEVAYGEPFKGPSGKLLDQVLKNYGYKRNEVLYTNVCLCRPPDNATPPKAATNACHERLMVELDVSGVRDIVALGGTASEALVDDSRKITNLRVGPPKQATAALIRRRTSNSAVDSGDSIRVVPTWHPAYCLRNSDAFPTLVSDIGKLRSNDRDAWRPPEWRYFDDPATARSILEELQARASHIVLDIEVGIEKDFAFGHPNEYDLLAVGLGYARGKVVVLGETALKDRSVLEGLKQLLQNVRIIAHNGKFDLGGLYPHLGGLELWFDTMLASYALDERPGGHKLKVLAVERLGAPQYDLEIRQYVPRKGNYADIPRPILYKYNAYDVACTWDLYELFEKELASEPVNWPYNTKPKTLRDVHDFMVAASNQLMYLELNGITIDRAYASSLRGIFLQRLGEVETKLDEIIKASAVHKVTLDKPTLTEIEEELALSGERAGINPRSPKQIKEFLHGQGIRVESTNVEVLKALRGRLDPSSFAGQFVHELLGYRRQHKLYSTYVEGIRKRTYRSRVYTTYLLHGTTSGRLASRNPNLQNIVRDQDIRRQFSVSKPENILVQADYKQAEARVIAVLAQDEYLRDILSRDDPNYDFFNELSDQLYGPGNWTKEVERVRTKAFFYGMGYGREAHSIAIEFKMPTWEAERLLNNFRALIPATVAWQNDVRKRVLATGSLVTPFGRRRRFWLITEQNKKDVLNEALSFLPQSTASDICLSAFTRIRPRLRGLGFVRLTIHDSLTAECAEAKRDEVAAILSEEMVKAGQEFTDYVPFPVDIQVGKTWGDFK